MAALPVAKKRARRTRQAREEPPWYIHGLVKLSFAAPSSCRALTNLTDSTGALVPGGSWSTRCGGEHTRPAPRRVQTRRAKYGQYSPTNLRNSRRPVQRKPLPPRVGERNVPRPNTSKRPSTQHTAHRAINFHDKFRYRGTPRPADTHGTLRSLRHKRNEKLVVLSLHDGDDAGAGKLVYDVLEDGALSRGLTPSTGNRRE